MKAPIKSSTQANITNRFILATQPQLLADAYGLNPRMDHRTPGDLYREVEIVNSLRGARALSLKAGDPMKSAFDLIRDPSISPVQQDHLIERAVNDFINARNLKATITEVSTKRGNFSFEN